MTTPILNRLRDKLKMSQKDSPVDPVVLAKKAAILDRVTAYMDFIRTSVPGASPVAEAGIRTLRRKDVPNFYACRIRVTMASKVHTFVVSTHQSNEEQVERQLVGFVNTYTGNVP